MKNSVIAKIEAFRSTGLSGAEVVVLPSMIIAEKTQDSLKVINRGTTGIKISTSRKLERITSVEIVIDGRVGIEVRIGITGRHEILGSGVKKSAGGKIIEPSRCRVGKSRTTAR